MATDLPVWISGTALVISLVSLGLSGFVARSNARIAKTQKRMELLTRLREVHIQYGELNRRYATLCKNFRSIPADVLEQLLKYKEYEKLTNGYYDFVANKDLSVTEAEEWRHHIESMLLHIASDNRRIDEWEKDQPRQCDLGPHPINPPDAAR